MKKLGILFILLGIIIPIFSSFYKNQMEIENMNEANEYIQETKRIVDKNQNNNSSKENKIRAELKQLKTNYTAILEIPKINLRRGVVNSSKGFKSINYAISVAENSKYPNEKGNFILFAHSGNSSIAFFKKLYLLNKEDDVYIYFNGSKYHYKIIKKYDIEKTGKARIIDSNSENYITFITCNQKKDGYQLVLIGKMIDKNFY